MERSVFDANFDSIQNQLKFIALSDKDSIEQNENGIIQHKIDISKAYLIDWDRLRNILGYQLQDKNGQCVYELRIYQGEIDDGNEEYTKLFNKIKELAEQLGSNIEIVKYSKGIFGTIWEFLLTQQVTVGNNLAKMTFRSNFNEIKIGLFGEEASGKSTTLGVLLNGNLDDGCGSARKTGFRFQHEIVSGKTLSISHHIIGFDQTGSRIFGKWEEMIQNTYKMVNLYDMGGSEKAMKTTLSLISPDYIDFFFLFTSARQGVTENTRMFLLLGNSMSIPIISVITCIDIINEDDLEVFIKNYKLLIKSCKLKKVPLVVRSFDDVVLFARNINENVHPIIVISNKTGLGLDTLLNMLSMLPNIRELSMPLQCNKLGNSMPSCKFDIHEHFVVDGKLILGGVVTRGRIMSGCMYYLGPNKNGNFKRVEVESIHCKKISSCIAFEGQFSSVSLSKIEKCDEIRKGMCLIDLNEVPVACKAFRAEIWSIESGLKTVKYKYEPVVIINHIRQSCKIKKYTEIGEINQYSEENSAIEFLEINDDDIEDYKAPKRTKTGIKDEDSFSLANDRKIELNFEFKNFPEYITLGSHLIINDNHLKAIGVITSVTGMNYK